VRRAPSLLARSLAKLEERLGPLADPVGATNRAGARGEVVSAAVADAFGRELRAAAVGAAVAAAGSEDAPANPEVRAAADAGARGFAARITPAGWRGDGARGALVRLPTGRLVQVNAGVVRTLPPLALPGA